MKKLITFFIFLFSITASLAQENYPKPTEKDVIFYIQHNRGKNTFTYQPNFNIPGKLNDKNPLIVRRQLYDNNGEIKSLSSIQRKYAYGIKSTKIANNVFDIRLVSYENQKLILKLDSKSKPYIETIINGKYMNINRLFIQQKDGTSGLKTKVDYILFIGKDKNDREFQEKLIL